MLIHLMKNAILWLNAFPESDGVSSEHSPCYLLTGYELAYGTHAVLKFGAYIQTHEAQCYRGRMRGEYSP